MLGRRHSLVAPVLGLTRCDIAGHRLPGRVDALQVVVAILFRGSDAGPSQSSARLPREPRCDRRYAATDMRVSFDCWSPWGCTWVDLREAGVAEVGALAVRAPDGESRCSHIAFVDRKNTLPSAAGRQDHRGDESSLPVDMSRAMMPRALPSSTMSSDHLMTRVPVTVPRSDLTLQRLVGPDQKRFDLSGPRAERGAPGHHRRAVVEATILAGEGTPCATLIDDDPALTSARRWSVVSRTVVAALDRCRRRDGDGSLSLR